MSLIVATVVGAILFLIRAICLVALLVISGNEGDLSAAGKGMSFWNLKFQYITSDALKIKPTTFMNTVASLYTVFFCQLYKYTYPIRIGILKEYCGHLHFFKEELWYLRSCFLKNTNFFCLKSIGPWNSSRFLSKKQLTSPEKITLLLKFKTIEPKIYLCLIFEKSSWKNQVWQTGLLVYFKLDFYCLWSLKKKSILKLILSSLIF